MNAYFIHFGLLQTLNCDHNQMFSEPKYLDIEQQLYPTITIEKQLIFDNQQDGFHFDIQQRLVYDSNKRSIDLTDPLNFVITKVYKSHLELSIFVYDPYEERYRSLTHYPFQNAIYLTQHFLEVDTIFFKIKQEENPFQNIVQCHELANNQQANANQNSAAVQTQAKSKRNKNIREMLQTVNLWRKLCIKSNNKITVQEGCQIIGISKRNLQFYIHNIKLGQKYGFQFHKNMQKKISQLKKFVDQKSQLKKLKELQMLNNLKKMYK